MDAGATWTHLGLKETHHIGRIVVNPTDPNIVYVAAVATFGAPTGARRLYEHRWRRRLDPAAEDQ